MSEKFDDVSLFLVRTFFIRENSEDRESISDVVEFVLISDGEPQQQPPFTINPGINDAWFNTDTAGQGFFIIVYPDLGIVFLSWFTFETSLPDESIPDNLGWAGHRWLTAVGPYSGGPAVLDIEFTTGGVFDSPEPKADQAPGGGTITLKFSVRVFAKDDNRNIGRL